MFPHNSKARGEATPRGLGARTPVRVSTPVPTGPKLREDSPTVTAEVNPVPVWVTPAVMDIEARSMTPDYAKTQYINMSGMSTW